MSEDLTRSEQPEEISDEKQRILDAKRKRGLYWQWYGWGVIALMILIIILNLFDLVAPEFNKYSMIAIVVAYGVYVVFRKK